MLTGTQPSRQNRHRVPPPTESLSVSVLDGIPRSHPTTSSSCVTTGHVSRWGGGLQHVCPIICGIGERTGMSAFHKRPASASSSAQLDKGEDQETAGVQGVTATRGPNPAVGVRSGACSAPTLDARRAREASSIREAPDTSLQHGRSGGHGLRPARCGGSRRQRVPTPACARAAGPGRAGKAF